MLASAVRLRIGLKLEDDEEGGGENPSGNVASRSTSVASRSMNVPWGSAKVASESTGCSGDGPCGKLVSELSPFTGTPAPAGPSRFDRGFPVSMFPRQRASFHAPHKNAVSITVRPWGTNNHKRTARRLGRSLGSGIASQGSDRARLVRLNIEYRRQSGHLEEVTQAFIDVDELEFSALIPDGRMRLDQLPNS